MAYKNRKENKRHIAELKKDPDGWRRQRKRKRIHKKPQSPISFEEM